MIGCLTLPAEIFARPGLAERVLAPTGPGEAPPAPPPGPTRAELLDLLR